MPKKTTSAKKTTTTRKSTRKKAVKTGWTYSEQAVAAYYHWLNRGAPIGDTQHDWFAVQTA